MLSNTGAYALRAVIYLARHEGEGPVRVDDVAAALEVPRNYLSKVLHALVKDGALGSHRGPAGGYHLAVPASELTLERVLAPFDTVDGRRRCLLREGECDEANPCPLHDRWARVATGVAAFFEGTVLKDVVGGAEEVEAMLFDDNERGSG